MPAFLRKYATATHVYIPIIKRGVVDFAVGADWTPATGDVKVSIDGGAAANIGTLPTAVAMGNTAYWDFTIAAGEATGKKIIVTVADSATKAVEDQAFVIETFGHASAEYQLDLTDTVRLGLTALPNAAANANGGLPILSSSGTTLAYTISTLTTYTGNTPQTGDCYPKVDTEVATLVAGVADVQARLPAALVGGRIDASVGAMASGVIVTATFGTCDFTATMKTSITAAVPTAAANAAAVEAAILNEGDATALLAAIGAKVETFIINDGDATATLAAIAAAVRTNLATELARIDVAISTRLASAGYTAPLDAAGTRTAVGLASANLDTQLAAASVHLVAIHKLEEADLAIDTGVTPWALVYLENGTGAIGVGTELLRQPLRDVAGTAIADTTTVIGRAGL